MMGSVIENSSVIVLDALSKTLQALSVGFNGAIIYTIWRKSLMRVPSSRFVFSLCLSHLLVSLTSLTISIISLFSPYASGVISTSESDGTQLYCLENTSAILNHVLLYITFGVAISTLITVTLISVERYITIARPMKYKSIVTARRCFVAISLSWILSAIIVIFPIIFFNQKTKQCGSFLIPIGNVGWYFAIVFTVLTILALSVMAICYSHIFTIAKEKCQKVQIGQFSASAPASISSDWNSSIYSGVQGQQNNRGWLNPGSRMASSNSLLHWVLMANLRHNANPIRSDDPKSPQLSPTSSLKSEPGPMIMRSPSGSTPVLNNPRLSKAKRKWRKYLQQNYNSPKKTVCTILVLIGSVILTQLPMSFVLFISLEKNPMLFYFCHDFLFALSSVTNPILYGFLNRNIRDQMCKIFRPKTTRRNRQRRANSMSNQSAVGELRDIFTPKTERFVINSRKGSLTSEDSNSSGIISTIAGKLTLVNSNSVPNHGTSGNSSSKINPFSPGRRDTMIALRDLDKFKLMRKHMMKFDCAKVSEEKLDVESSDKESEGSKSNEMISCNEKVEEGVKVEDLQNEEIPHLEDHGFILEDEILQNLEFPRKPSQDSGADMTFSGDEDQDDHDQEEVSVTNIKENSSRSLRVISKVENYLRIYDNVSLADVKKSKSKSDSDMASAGLQNSLQANRRHYQPKKQNKILINPQCQLGPEMLIQVRHVEMNSVDVNDDNDDYDGDDTCTTTTMNDMMKSSSQKIIQQLALGPLSSSRQNLLPGVHHQPAAASTSHHNVNSSNNNIKSNSSKDNCNYSRDDLLELVECSGGFGNSSSNSNCTRNRLEFDDISNRSSSVICSDLIKIGNVFQDESFSNNGLSNDSSSSSSSTNSDSGSSSCDDSATESDEDCDEVKDHIEI